MCTHTRTHFCLFVSSLPISIWHNLNYSNFINFKIWYNLFSYTNVARKMKAYFLSNIYLFISSPINFISILINTLSFLLSVYMTPLCIANCGCSYKRQVFGLEMHYPAGIFLFSQFVGTVSNTCFRRYLRIHTHVRAHTHIHMCVYVCICTSEVVNSKITTYLFLGRVEEVFHQGSLIYYKIKYWIMNITLFRIKYSYHIWEDNIITVREKELLARF